MTIILAKVENGHGKSMENLSALGCCRDVFGPSLISFIELQRIRNNVCHSYISLI